MRLRHLAILALLALLAATLPARADDPSPPPVPGPLRPLPPPGEAPAPSKSRLPGLREPIARDAPAPVPAPPRVVRAWIGRLGPLLPGEPARGTVRLDVATHQVRIDDFAVTGGPDLEVVLVAADRPETTAAVLAAKRVSLGRLKRVRPTVVLRYPAELDPAVYRTLIVWSRHEPAPRGLARLVPDKAS
jgi:hypothetical protein